MQLLTRRALGAAGLALVMATASAAAQQAPTVRVRGEITKVDGSMLTVKSRSGEMLTVKLAEPMRVAAMVKSSLADIKEGSFIGVSAMGLVTALTNWRVGFGLGALMMLLKIGRAHV